MMNDLVGRKTHEKDMRVDQRGKEGKRERRGKGEKVLPMVFFYGRHIVHTGLLLTRREPPLCKDGCSYH